MTPIALHLLAQDAVGSDCNGREGTRGTPSAMMCLLKSKDVSRVNALSQQFDNRCHDHRIGLYKRTLRVLRIWIPGQA